MPRLGVHGSRGHGLQGLREAPAGRRGLDHSLGRPLLLAERLRVEALQLRLGPSPTPPGRSPPQKRARPRPPGGAPYRPLPEPAHPPGPWPTCPGPRAGDLRSTGESQRRGWPGRSPKPRARLTGKPGAASAPRQPTRGLAAFLAGSPPPVGSFCAGARGTVASAGAGVAGSAEERKAHGARAMREQGWEISQLCLRCAFEQQRCLTSDTSAEHAVVTMSGEIPPFSLLGQTGRRRRCSAQDTETKHSHQGGGGIAMLFASSAGDLPIVGPSGQPSQANI